MPDSRPKILVIDDEESICQLLEIMLTEEGYWVQTVTNYNDAMNHLESESFDLIVSDIMMPGKDGLTLLKDAKQFDPDLPIILITAYASLSSAVEALRKGAFDYITKPFQIDQIKFSVKRALEVRMLRRENRILRKTIRNESELDKLIGKSPAIRKIKELVARIAPSQSTVLVTGESGTGKELLARAIHSMSERANGPFVTINCAALPETLLESELFGYVRGAFTGADKDKDGLFRVADHGTFFLDEVGETSMAIQAKLLRILETNEFTPLGATKPIKVDIRLIAATNRELKQMVDDSKFRQDLFYRLNVLNIHIPPLRDRREDILPISEVILQSLSARTKSEIKTLSPQATEILINSNWEGNVRELENILERAVLICDKEMILPKHLPSYLTEKKQTKQELAPDSSAKSDYSLGQIIPLEEIEKAYIFWALSRVDFNKSEAAKLLGIDLSTLYRKIDKYGLKKIIPQ
jgi:DNA-binding NtrC family response regulator